MKKLYILPIIFFLTMPILSAQMYPDRHNTNWFDGWISCTSSLSPNATRGDIHWVMYDLGFDYPLSEISLWNCNIPDSTDMGLQNVIIDYSKDGIDWEEVGDYTLSQSTGSSIYQGEVIGDFGGQTARYILINAMSNYGGSCYSFSELRINIAESAVPVELVSFDVNCNENFEIIVEWSTSSEINNAYFDILKSSDGEYWEIVGTVDATVDPQESNHYTFVDKSKNEAVSYYKLAQYDLDGHRTDYNVAATTCDREISEISLYPNPVENKLQILITSKESEFLRGRLINAIGEELREFNISTNVEMEIETKDLPSGQYFFQIEMGSKRFKEKFVKI